MRLRNRGPRTLNGDSGVAKTKGPDGTTFTFSACSLSSNGTNHNRGQIPQILYYRSVRQSSLRSNFLFPFPSCPPQAEQGVICAI